MHARASRRPLTIDLRSGHLGAVGATDARGGWWRALGPPRPLRPEHRRLLVLLGTAFMMNNYDFGILSLALPQIQADLGVAEAAASELPAAARLGVLPALFLGLIADRRGRRLLLVLTVVGFSVCTLLTGFARSAGELMLLQFGARTFTAAEEMLAIVVLTEELEPDCRGWGVGVMAAFGGLGHGLASVLYAQVEVLPYGWRALYVVGATPLLLLAWLRRGLPETQRFTAYRARRGAPGAFFEPVRRLLRAHPGRLAALCAAIAPFWFVASTALVFMSKFLQETHGYTPGSVAILFLAGGSIAIFGNLVAGRLSDRFGRRPIAIGFLVANFAAVAGFYNAAGAWLLPACWIVLIFSFFAIDVIFTALGSELFPTAYRSTASSVRGVVGMLAGAFGLWIEGWLFTLTGSHAQAITWMLSVALVTPIVVACSLPETAGRRLEEIAPEL
jgi:putative MFS transporter